MNKYEFITALQRHLTGKISAQKLQELTNYYNDYIDTEIRKGKSEDEVLASLGEPRLLAKSIVAAESRGATEDAEFREYGYANETSEQDDASGAQFIFNGKAVSKWKFWAITAIILLVILAVLTLFFRILGFALVLIFKYIVPVVLPLAIIYLIFVWLTGKKW